MRPLHWRPRSPAARPGRAPPPPHLPDPAAAAHTTWATAWAAAIPGPDLAPLAAAASYLDVPALLDLAVAALAARLAGRPGGAVRAEFGLPDDLPASEAAAVRADCAGAFDAW